MDVYRCKNVSGPLDAVVRVPGSKSLTNRALVLAALADGVSVLDNILLAEDTRIMLDALRALGIAATVDESSLRAEITGCGGQLPESEAELFCGNSGTTIRFLAALCAAGYGHFTLDGVPRMRQRPIGALGSALQTLGCGVEYLESEGFPPLRLHAQGLRGGHVAFDAPESSQMVSAILMAAPYAGRDLFIEVTGDLPSRPFVDMTIRLMDQFGVVVLADRAASAHRSSRFVVEAPQRYRATNLAIEPDATNAMYFLAAAAVCGGRVTVEGLGDHSLQGDVRFVDVLAAMGCAVERGANRLTVNGPSGQSPLRGIDVDLGDMPDTAQTLAVIALFAEGPTRIRDIANLRVKETDRIAAMTRELTRLGARVEESADGLTIHPSEQLHPVEIDTYNDHRMAMSFALAGLRVPGLVIRDPQCCEKTFPDFFLRLQVATETGRP